MDVPSFDFSRIKESNPFYQLLIFLFIMGFLSLFTGILVIGLGKVFPYLNEWNVVLSYFLSFGLIFLTVQQLWQVKKIEWSRVSIIVFVIVVPLVLLLSVPLEGVVSLIPMPESIRQKFEALITLDLKGYITIGIAAPFLEELIFRGVLLKSMLERFSPLKSILWSSIIFGIAHLNPWQFIPACMIGFFMGWVYWKTRSLWPVILIHFVNNSFSFGVGYFTKDVNTSYLQLVGGIQNYLLLIFFSLVLSLLLIWSLARYFRLHELTEQNPEKSVFAHMKSTLSD